MMMVFTDLMLMMISSGCREEMQGQQVEVYYSMGAPMEQAQIELHFIIILMFMQSFIRHQSTQLIKMYLGL